jgi:hypothetical protein
MAGRGWRNYCVTRRRQLPPSRVFDSLLYQERGQYPLSCEGVGPQHGLYGSASELLLLRLCRGCVPFKVEGGLRDSLLLPEDGGELLPVVSTEDVREKVMSRLGLALDASRRRHKEPAR